MPSYNHIVMLGNLTRDPELRYTGTGSPVLNSAIAVNHHWTDSEGVKKETVCFLEFTAWSKNAENLAKFTRKGSTVLLDGRLDQNTWDDNGTKRSKHFLQVESFTLCDRKPENAPAGAAPAAKPKQNDRRPQPAR